MAKPLTDTARIILTAATTRGNRHVLPLPGTLRAPAHIVTKTMEALLEHGLIAEVAAEADDAVWAQTEGGGKTTLVVTPAGLAAIGIDAEGAPADAPADKPRTSGRKRAIGTKGTVRSNGAPRATVAPTGAKQSKQGIVVALLRRQQGASIPQLAEATGWLPHSVRGFLTAVVKGKLGLPLVSEKGADGVRRYYIAPIKQTDPS